MKSSGTLKITVLAMIFVLLGCATKYQPAGVRFGYRDIQVDKNTYRVTFEANTVTDSMVTSEYLLYRCAELTLEKGFGYFVVIRSEDLSTTIGSCLAGPEKYPSYAKTIRIFKGKKTEGERNMYDARIIVESLRNRIKR
jgi:hypothetical protein